MKIVQNSISLFIIGLLLMVFFGVGSLSYEEFTEHNICPKLIGIPACYIIFGCVFLIFTGHFIKSNALFFIAASIPFTIAIIASALQFFDKAQCPKTSSGIPMCYLSFLFFSLIIILKLRLIKNVKIKTLKK